MVLVYVRRRTCYCVGEIKEQALDLKWNNTELKIKKIL